MFIKEKLETNNKEDLIKIFNFNVYLLFDDFYKNVSSKSIMIIKSCLLNILIYIERIFKGTFHKDIFLKNIDLNKFRLMFPNISQNIFVINDDEDILKLGGFLETSRNIMSHSINSKEDILNFKEFKVNIFKFNPYDNKIKFYDENDELTLAGFLYILLNFLDEESIKPLYKEYLLIRLFYLNDPKNIKKFIDEISLVNLEIPIRENNENTLISSVLGAFKDKINTLGEFKITLGPTNYPIFRAIGSINKNEIIIYKTTKTGTYYKEDFKIKILDEARFIFISNSLPEFMLLDYLYIKDIHEFNKNILLNEDELNILSTTNKPKFYVEKNLDILMNQNKNYDSKLVSNILTIGLTNLLRSFEFFLCFYTKNFNRNNYSKLSDLLDLIEVPNELKEEIIYLRNAVCHGAKLYEYFGSIYKENQITAEGVMELLYEFGEYLKYYNKDLYETYLKSLKINVLNSLRNNDLSFLIKI